MTTTARIGELTALLSTCADDPAGRARTLIALRDAVDLCLAETIDELNSDGVTLWANLARDGSEFVANRSDLHPAEVHRLAELGAALPQMPATRAALEQGDITTTRAALIAQARDAEGFAEAEPRLVAQVSNGKLREARQVIRRHMVDTPAKDPLPKPKSWLRLRRRDDGTYKPDGVLDAELGAMVVAELRARADAYKDTKELTPGERLALGLGEAIRRSMTLARPSDTRPEVVVVANMDIHGELVDPHTESGEPVAKEIFARLCCDATIRGLLSNYKSEILDLGRAERTVTRAQRRALNHRDGGCTYPGCAVTPEYCDAHHLHWWERGGPTDLEKLARS